MTIDQKVSDATSWQLQKRGEAAVRALRKRQIGAVWVRSRSEALSELLSMIPDGATVRCQGLAPKISGRVTPMVTASGTQQDDSKFASKSMRAGAGLETASCELSCRAPL